MDPYQMIPEECGIRCFVPQRIGIGTQSRGDRDLSIHPPPLLRTSESELGFEESVSRFALGCVEAVFLFVEDLLEVRFDTVESKNFRYCSGHRFHDGTGEWGLIQ